MPRINAQRHGCLLLACQSDFGCVVGVVMLQLLEPPVGQVEQGGLPLRAGLLAALQPKRALAQKAAQAGINQAGLVLHLRVALGGFNRLANECKVGVLWQGAGGAGGAAGMCCGCGGRWRGSGGLG